MKMYKVGGAVRDELLGLSPKDVDYVVVGATEADMLAAGYKKVGADFPVFLDFAGTEYALARTERKVGHGYNGFQVNFDQSVTLEDDLARRDLTINAMAMDSDGTLVDPFGGQNDLENKVLRHVSAHFADDPVRVLRLARFHARYGHQWTVDPDTVEFCRSLAKAGELAYLTPERVLKEMEKAMSEKNPILFFTTLWNCHALDIVFPELADIEWGYYDTYRNSTAKLNYARLTYWTKNFDALEARLNVSNEWKSYAKLFRALNKGIVDMFSTDDDNVQLLYQLDVYRRQNLWEELMNDAVAAGILHYARINQAFYVTKDVGFESLSDVEKETLRGPEISQAIRRKRINVYNNFVYKTKAIYQKD